MICIVCNIDKNEDEFYKYSSGNPMKKCKSCLCEERRQYRKDNLDKIKERKREYYKENKEHIVKKAKNWVKNNPEKRKEIRKREYQKRKANQNDVIRDRLRSRLYRAIKNDGGRKTYNTEKYIGCEITTLKAHLQQTAINNNYTDFDIELYDGSEFHIDHIIPCSSFDLTDIEEQKKCFHYTNLQILDATANMVKSDNLI